MKIFPTCLALAIVVFVPAAFAAEPRPHIAVRGIYGGVPVELMERGASLADRGVTAIWIGSGQLTAERVAQVKTAGAQIFAEFNTLHERAYVARHPDAAPVGADGNVCPPPEGWQGVCPTHAEYRKHRMEAFRRALTDFEIDGIWLDYLHGQASWERAAPNLPDTCFCRSCLAGFQRDTGMRLPERPVAELSALLLGKHRARWVQWRCDVLTDWMREFREIRDAVRPAALLGTFHCPWSETDFDGALREKLAIDLKAQARHIDVFSPMPYHARFGHARDVAWISRQISWLGKHLSIDGAPNARHRIWPIVQLADWGEPVPSEQVQDVLEHATRRPATGVMVFAWSRLRQKPDSVAAMSEYYRAIGAAEAGKLMSP